MISQADTVSTVVFAPHVDDEVLGCFSFLMPGTHVLYGGVEERPAIPRQTRINELENASSMLGFSWSMLDNPVNNYAASKLIGPMEAIIDRVSPQTVVIPEPSYNQDHRAFYDAALVATRPHDTHQLVPEVLIYEQPHSILWPHTDQPTPSVFVPIDIKKKLDAYQCYASQVRGHRSPETVTALAAIRGAQIMVPFAEAFHARRIVRSVRKGGTNL